MSKTELLDHLRRQAEAGRVLRDVVPVDPHGLRQLVLLHGEMVIAVQLGLEAEQQRIREHPRL